MASNDENHSYPNTIINPVGKPDVDHTVPTSEDGHKYQRDGINVSPTSENPDDALLQHCATTSDKTHQDPITEEVPRGMVPSKPDPIIVTILKALS